MFEEAELALWKKLDFKYEMEEQDGEFCCSVGLPEIHTSLKCEFYIICENEKDKVRHRNLEGHATSTVALSLTWRLHLT